MRAGARAKGATGASLTYQYHNTHTSSRTHLSVAVHTYRLQEYHTTHISVVQHTYQSYSTHISHAVHTSVAQHTYRSYSTHISAAHKRPPQPICRARCRYARRTATNLLGSRLICQPPAADMSQWQPICAAYCSSRAPLTTNMSGPSQPICTSCNQHAHIGCGTSVVYVSYRSYVQNERYVKSYWF